MLNNRRGNYYDFQVSGDLVGKTIEEIFKSIWVSPKKLTHQFRMEKKVLVNHEYANWTSPLNKDDLLSIDFFSQLEDTVKPSFLDIEVLYEDDHLIIVNKPANIDTHPNEPDQIHTLLNGVAYYLKEKGHPAWVKHIHRLDHNTTGAIMFAKHPLIGSILDGMLEKRLIKRTYLALVQGELKRKLGIINAPIGRDRHHNTRRRVSPSGQKAVTHYHVVEGITLNHMTLIKCWLETGRTHQIRVHLSSISHPIVGDTLYGGKAIFARQALHAVKLEFIHPFTKTKVTCHAPFTDSPPIFPAMEITNI